MQKIKITNQTLTKKKTEELHQAKEQKKSFFWGNFQIERNFQQQTNKRATPLQRMNKGYRVKKQYGKEKQNILSTKLHDRSINKYRLGSNQTYSRG
jgi:hypothetical protein